MFSRNIARAIAIAAFFSSCAPRAYCGRPLFVDDAPPVAQGQVEIELGLTHAQPRGGGREQKLPVITIAYGMTRHLELGVAIQRANTDLAGQRPLEGVEDLHVNFKHKAVDEDLHLPMVSLSVDIKTPTANRKKGLSTGRADETFLLVASKHLSPAALDMNLGYLLVRSPPGDKLKNRILGGSALRWALDARWTFVAEVFGLSRAAARTKNEANFQTGFRYHWHPRFVLDAGVGRSLRSTGNRVHATAGLTWTFHPLLP